VYNQHKKLNKSANVFEKNKPIYKYPPNGKIVSQKNIQKTRLKHGLWLSPRKRRVNAIKI